MPNQPLISGEHELISEFNPLHGLFLEPGMPFDNYDIQDNSINMFENQDSNPQLINSLNDSNNQSAPILSNNPNSENYIENENDAFEILNILNNESDNDTENNNLDQETNKFKSYFEFLENIKSSNNNEKIKCICGSELSSRKTFSNHKNTCKSIRNIILEYNNYSIKFLPQTHDYLVATKSVSTIGNFENWFKDLNSTNHKYVIKSSHFNSKVNKTYKNIKCHAFEVKKCDFQINAIVTGENINFTLIGYHNHSSDAVYTDKAGNETSLLLKNSRLDEDVKEKLLNYFYQGYAPTKALEKLKFDSENYMEDSKYRSRIPYLRTVYYLFEKERIINFGSAEISETALKNFENEFKDRICLKYKQNNENQWIIAYCSKIMIGSIKSREISKYIVCIDSTGGMDRSSGHLFNLVIPGPTGGLSIGMFVTFSESKSDIKNGLLLLKEIWENNGINNFEPVCFMSDDCAAQIGALSEIFPNSITLLCQFHVVQALWRWLQSNELKKNRMQIINRFRKAMYKDNFSQNKQKLFTEISGNEKLTKHFEKVFKKEQWFASVFRKNYNLLGVDTNNLVERSFLNIKQKFLERNKVYNCIQLIQQIVLQYDKLTEIKMIDFIHSRKQYIYKAFKKADRSQVKLLCKNIIEADINQHQVLFDTFESQTFTDQADNFIDNDDF